MLLHTLLRPLVCLLLLRHLLQGLFESEIHISTHCGNQTVELGVALVESVAL